MPFHDIETPTLLFSESICRRNISRMAEKARKHSLHFRPHFKTHQSRRIASFFRDAKVRAITVSSVRMARYFADDGWDDITIAFPVNLREITAINRLAQRIRLSLLVEAPDVIRRLDAALQHPVGVFLKIDTGYGRTGIRYDREADIAAAAAEIAGSRNLAFHGLLTHGGNSYHAASQEEIRQGFDRSRQRLLQSTQQFRETYPALILSAGDTPGCSLAENFEGLHEIRPGNFVFHDVMQLRLGSCAAGDIAVAAACPVVALHHERNEAVLYGGSIHLSKEGLTGADGHSQYGLAALLTDEGWSEPLPDTFVSALSQEHGILHSTSEILALLREGMLIAVLPVHSCLTSEAMRAYLSLDGSFVDHMAGSADSHTLHARP